MKVSSVTCSVISALWLSGCAYTPAEQADGSFAYTEAKLQQPIQAADGRSAPTLRDNYSIPPQRGQGRLGAAVSIAAPALIWPTAPGSRVEEAEAATRIYFDEIEGTSDVTGMVWDSTLARLNAAGINHTVVTPQQRIETDWLRSDYEVGEEQALVSIERRFALSFVTPSHGRTVAVEVSQIDQRMLGDGASQRSFAVDDRNAAVALLNGVTNEVAVRHRAGQVPLSEDSYEVTAGFDGKGYPALWVETSFINTWSLLGAALPELGFVIDDLNQSTGFYYTSYGKAPSGLAALAFWRDTPEGELALADGEYEIQVTGDRVRTSITFYRDDKPLSAAEVTLLYAPIAAEFRRQLEL